MDRCLPRCELHRGLVRPVEGVMHEPAAVIDGGRRSFHERRKQDMKRKLLELGKRHARSGSKRS